MRKKYQNRYLNNIRIPTKATNTAVAFLSCCGVNIILPMLLPICPPKKTVMSRMEVRFQSISKSGFEYCPNKPAIEFTKIKKLAAAEIFFGVSQFVK
jgi:hypothetical protein